MSAQSLTVYQATSTFLRLDMRMWFAHCNQFCCCFQCFGFVLLVAFISTFAFDGSSFLPVNYATNSCVQSALKHPVCCVYRKCVVLFFPPEKMRMIFYCKCLEVRHWNEINITRRKSVFIQNQNAKKKSNFYSKCSSIIYYHRLFDNKSTKIQSNNWLKQVFQMDWRW